jgi:hypothetical protein
MRYRSNRKAKKKLKHSLSAEGKRECRCEHGKHFFAEMGKEQDCDQS